MAFLPSPSAGTTDARSPGTPTSTSSPRCSDGADWDVTFTPFSLSQVHVAEGDPSVWDTPEKAPDLLALNAGVVVRDRFPDQFLDAH